MFNRLKKYFMRRQHPVVFRDYTRTEPVCREFGVQNGTPIDRYYIERFLEDNQAWIRGVVGEVAENSYSVRLGKGVTRSIIFNYDSTDSTADIRGDLTQWHSLPKNIFDCFVCTQTLNFIFDVSAAIKGLARMIKPDGILLGTVAGLSQVSRFDYERWGDYWRFTDLSLTRLLSEEFEEVKTAYFGNLCAATALLDGVTIEQLPERSVLDVTDGDYQLVIGFFAGRPKKNETPESAI